MFAQFFGGYLLHNKLVTAQDLTQAFEDKKNTRLRLGVLAINAGLMTADQVEHVNVTQQSVDKRFGDLAVELGYVTAEQVDELLSQQPTDYLLLGQTLVNNGILSNAQFEEALKSYKAEAELDDSDLEGSQAVNKLVSEFYHLEGASNARILTEYVTMLFKSIIRFIDTDFTPLEATMVRSFESECFIKQEISGAYNALTCVASGREEFKAFAQRFAGDSFGDVEGFLNETIGEFLNVINGLFAVNESNEHGNEITMLPQEACEGNQQSFEKPVYCIPVVFSFGEVDFLVGAD